MSANFVVILLIVLGILPGCSDKDASDSPRFKDVVGRQYEVIGRVDAYGIRKHSAAGVDYIVLIPPPGVAGPEVGFQVPVKIGSKITVLNVVRTNRLIDPDMTLIVQLEGTPTPIDKQIRVDLFRGNQGKSRMSLNPEIYRQMHAK